MKKITLFLALTLGFTAHSAIVVRDIEDYTFTMGSNLAFDFNNDDTSEFSFNEEGGFISCYFDFEKVNFVGTGTLESGHGWDIMKALPNGTLINGSSSFDAQGDAYLNPVWGEATDFFPQGDSFIGTKFQLNGQFHYGWILINVTNTDITVKSYAYNTVANEGIIAGQALANDSFLLDNVFVGPNPVQDYLTISDSSMIHSVQIFDALGRNINKKLNNSTIDFSDLKTGTYFLIFTMNDKSTYKRQIVKK